MLGVSAVELTLAGAAFIGLVVGVTATIKVFRIVVDYLRRQREED